jgi:hypothetical protein
MKQKKKKWFWFAGLAAAIALFSGCEPDLVQDAVYDESPGILSLKVAGVEAEISSDEIIVYIPYEDGFNPASLDVSVELEEGAALIPLIKGKQDFSKPKKITARTADGKQSDYTVAVYALFSGPESLPALAAYTDWANGNAPMPDPNNPFYIALEGIDLYDWPVKTVQPFEDNADGQSATGLARIFGVTTKTQLPGYTHGQYIALDLSHYTDIYVLPGTHSIWGGHSNYPEGPLARVTSIRFPPNLRVLGEFLFQGNEALTSVELPEGLVIIENNAFAGASKLKDVKLPSTLKNIGNVAFIETAIENIEFPEGLVSIGSGAFYGSKIKRVVLPSSVVSVTGPFAGSLELEYADFSKTQITNTGGIKDFSTCEKLKELRLPETLVNIARFSYSLEDCKSLEKLVIEAPVPPKMETEYSTALGSMGKPMGPYTGLSSNFKIYVPDESVELYKNAGGFSAGWAEYADKIYPISALGEAAE